jgi:large subunit ribosomal protein L17
MRHGDKINHLGRTYSHRKAMLKNMACSLIEHKRIKTTVAKAKELRKFIEPLINKSKISLEQDVHAATHTRRIAFAALQNKEAVKELFGSVAHKVGNRMGGYTRILKIGNRLGDNAEMAIIELVDYNELYSGKATASTGKKRRRQKSKSSDAEATTEEVVATDVQTVENTDAAAE